MVGDVEAADTVAAGARTGQVLAGKYSLLRLIGRGGMGEVYEARHLVVGRRFAVKFLHAQAARGSAAAERFLREARAAGALENPHLAAVLDFDVAIDGAPFLIMEYLSGETLARTLKREGRLPVTRALALLLQACDGLSAAHRAGIVHRDLKPDNLFLEQRGDGSELLKIVDFGIAKLMGEAGSSDLTTSGAVLGTPHYMAPEQARGERTLDHRVDVHALGVIAYELLSGQKPHPGDSYNAILAHILTEPIEPLARLCPGLPSDLVSVIERAMAAQRDERQPSVESLAAELRPFLGRQLTPGVDAFDPRSRPRLPLPSSELRTSASTVTEQTPETLQSAVGDVSASPSPSRTPRALLALTGAAAAGFAIWLATGRARPPEPAASTHTAETARVTSSVAITAQPSSSVAAEDAARASESAAPPAAIEKTSSRPVVREHAATAAAASTRAQPRKSPPPAASLGTAASPGVSFDEKNPY